MADIELKRAHHLGLKGARAAAEKMAEKLGKQFNLSGTWTGNTLHFDRPGVNGALSVSDKDMHLAVTLGFLLKAMKGPIERAVHEQLDKVLKDAPAETKAAPKEKAASKPAKTPAKAPPKSTAKTAAKSTAKKK